MCHRIKTIKNQVWDIARKTFSVIVMFIVVCLWINVVHRWAFSVFSVFFILDFSFFFGFQFFSSYKKKAFTTTWTSMILFSLMHSLKIIFVATNNGGLFLPTHFWPHREFIIKTFRHLQTVVTQNFGLIWSKMGKNFENPQKNNSSHRWRLKRSYNTNVMSPGPKLQFSHLF